MLRICNSKDFWAGLLFMTFGSAGMWMAYSFPFGSAARMGPAYFPTLIGALLTILGLYIALRGVVSGGYRMDRFHLKPLVMVLVSIALFGFFLQHVGLVSAIFAIIIFASMGGHEFRLREVLLLATILAVGAVAVFVYGLKLQIQVWPFFY